MDERHRELFWYRAERWVNDVAFARLHRGKPVCPMCGVLLVEGTFLINGVALALCAECAGELTTKKRRVRE